jgi:hypothetical protein
MRGFQQNEVQVLCGQRLPDHTARLPAGRLDEGKLARRPLHRTVVVDAASRKSNRAVAQICSRPILL